MPLSMSQDVLFNSNVFQVFSHNTQNKEKNLFLLMLVDKHTHQKVVLYDLYGIVYIVMDETTF